MLVVAGGIGFLTLEELYLWRKSRRGKRVFRLSLHSRLVLITTAILLVAPWPVLVWLEWNVGLRELGFFHKFTNAGRHGSGAINYRVTKVLSVPEGK